MKYLKNNTSLLLKYLSVIISNLLIYIIISFYFKSMENNFLIMLFVAVIVDIIIFNYKIKVECNYWLDLLCCIISGVLLNFFIKIDLIYSTILFTLFFANNIVFMKTRKEEKLLKKAFQYLMIFVVTIISMFINLALRIYI